MTELKRGIVGIIDILGVKGIWTRESPELILEKWKDILKNLKENVDIFTNIIDKKEKDGRDIKDYSFSDTIIMTISSDSYQSLLIMCGIIGDVFSVALESGLLFRGAISVGEYYSFKNMLIGPAVDDAAEWYDISDWAGVILTPKASYFIDHSIMAGAKKEKIKYLLAKYDIPLKNEKSLTDNWTVSWPSIYLKYDKKGQKKSISDFRQDILKIFSNNPIGPKQEKKYSNTLLFYDYVVNSII